MKVSKNKGPLTPNEKYKKEKSNMHTAMANTLLDRKKETKKQKAEREETESKLNRVPAQKIADNSTLAENQMIKRMVVRKAPQQDIDDVTKVIKDKSKWRGNTQTPKIEGRDVRNPNATDPSKTSDEAVKKAKAEASDKNKRFQADVTRARKILGEHIQKTIEHNPTRQRIKEKNAEKSGSNNPNTIYLRNKSNIAAARTEYPNDPDVKTRGIYIQESKGVTKTKTKSGKTVNLSVKIPGRRIETSNLELGQIKAIMYDTKKKANGKSNADIMHEFGRLAKQEQLRKEQAEAEEEKKRQAELEATKPKKTSSKSGTTTKKTPVKKKTEKTTKTTTKITKGGKKK